MFPGDLVVRILGFHCCDPSSVPGWGIEILQMTPPSKKVTINITQIFLADGD